MDGFLALAGKSGRPALGVWCTVADALSAETIASEGPDYVCIDTQHGAPESSSLIGMLQAVKAGGSQGVVRVREDSPALIMKALDAGAAGVIVPLVESAAQASRAVGACTFPPVGSRSYGPFRAAMARSATTPEELADVSCIVMVETRSALEHLEEIAATPGLAAIYVGPSDLSLALGLPPASFGHPQLESALEDIRAACERNGIAAGIHTYDGRTAARYAEAGFAMITVGVDLRLLRAAVRDQLGAARSAR